MTTDVDVLIVGAGLAGLSTACHLPKGVSFRIIEAEHTPGGTAATTTEQGMSFDKTGHLLHLRDPEIKRWILGLMGDDLLLIQRVSRIWSNGVYTKYPFQSNTFGLPAAVARECLVEYFKTLTHPSKKPIRTFEDFIYTHFGAGFAKHFMIPYNKKIWGVHPREMTPAWCQRFVPIPKFESIIEGIFDSGTKELGYNTSFYYPKHGIQMLANRLAAEVERRQRIEYGVRLKAINTKKRLATLSTGEVIHYTSLVSTIPLNRLVASLSDAPASIRAKGKLLRVKPLQYLDVMIKSSTKPFFHWCYVPSLNVPFYRIGVYSNFSDAGVPTDRATLYVELASRTKPNLTTLKPILAREFVAMGLVTKASDIEKIYPRTIDCAYVIYDHNYERTVPALHTYLNKEHVYSIGRYGRWEYAAMEDALIQGKATAALIA